MAKFSAKIPRFRVKLSTVLRPLLVAVILAEALLLYKYLYLDAKEQAQIPLAQEPTPSLRIDFAAAQRLQEWYEAQAAYKLSDYDLATPALGRENPFAKY